MTSAYFNSELLRRFPQLRAARDREFGYFGDEEPGPYIVFGILLMPEIDRAAEVDADYFHRLMDFIEEIASDPVDGSNLVMIELGEFIQTLKHEELVRRAAGPNTLRAITRADDSAMMATLHLDRSPIASVGRKIASTIAVIIVWAISARKRKPC